MQQPQMQGVTPQGTQQPPGTSNYSPGSEDGWNYEEGTPGAYGYTEQQPTPTQQPAPQQQNVAPFDPQNLGQQLLPILDQLVEQRLGNVTQLITQQTQAGMQQLQQERTVQDQIRSTYDAARLTRAGELNKLNLTEDQVRNILDSEDLAQVLNREAEMLIQEGGAANLNTARAKITQAGSLQSRAATDRAAAMMDFQRNEQQRQYDTQIDIDPYKALSVDEPKEIDYNLTNPAEIERANQESLQAAIQLAEARERTTAATGM
jgi:hypothetical protein